MNKGNLMLILAQTHVQTQHGLKTNESTWLGQWDDKNKQTKSIESYEHFQPQKRITVLHSVQQEYGALP